jgi:hypothetical protein
MVWLFTVWKEVLVMVVSSRFRRVGAAAVLVVAGVGAVASSADAAVAPRGYTAVQSCTGLSGSISYTPGLIGTARTGSAVFTGTVSGCSGFNGAEPGTGTVTAVLSGTSTASSVTESGQLTVNWPASSGLNPSNAAVTLRETSKNGPISVSGTVTSGAYTGAVLSSDLLPYAHRGAGTKAHPLKAQTVTNTAPFTAKVNLG